MNKEDITRLAQEAGFVGMDGDHGALRRFAALVASAERESCAKIGDDHPSWSSRMYSATIRARGDKHD